MKHPIDHQRIDKVYRIALWIALAILLAGACLGCRQLLYTDAERDAAYLGRDAAQHLYREDTTDFRRQTVAGALDASVSRLGRPDNVPHIPQWKSPEVATRKEVAEVIEQGKQDGKRDRTEVIISQAKATADKVKTETEGIPLIPGIAVSVSAILGTLGLAWRKVRKVRVGLEARSVAFKLATQNTIVGMRSRAEDVLEQVVRAVDDMPRTMDKGEFKKYVKARFKAAHIPELNAAVERVAGRG